MNCSRTFPEGQHESTHDGTRLRDGVFVRRVSTDETAKAVILCTHVDPNGRDEATVSLRVDEDALRAIVDEFFGTSQAATQIAARAAAQAMPMGSGVAAGPEDKVVGSIAPAPAVEAAAEGPSGLVAPSEPPTSEGSGAPPA